jgi:hypothetical protein
MQRLYQSLAKLLIVKGYVTQEIVNTIARKGTRKEYIWKRHILDLCDFVLDNRQVDNDVRILLEKCIKLVLTK